MIQFIYLLHSLLTRRWPLRQQQTNGQQMSKQVLPVINICSISSVCERQCCLRVQKQIWQSVRLVECALLKLPQMRHQIKVKHTRLLLVTTLVVVVWKNKFAQANSNIRLFVCLSVCLSVRKEQALKVHTKLTSVACSSDGKIEEQKEREREIGAKA